MQAFTIALSVTSIILSGISLWFAYHALTAPYRNTLYSKQIDAYLSIWDLIHKYIHCTLKVYVLKKHKAEEEKIKAADAEHSKSAANLDTEYRKLELLFTDEMNVRYAETQVAILEFIISEPSYEFRKDFEKLGKSLASI
jgi:hypothetical protein